MAIHHQVLFLKKILIQSVASLLFKNKTFCFSKARLSIKNSFHKRVSRNGNQFLKEGNASTV
jgi:hypothetical protein